MKAKLIDKEGNEEVLPYYEVEQKCIEIIGQLNSDMKLKFEEFKQNYHYFTPYFDFVMMELGYVIENPMGYNNSLLVFHNNKFYILENTNYELYQKGCVSYSEYLFFDQCDDTILRVESLPDELKMFPEGLTQLKSGIIDRKNQILSLADMKFHQNLAILIVNQLIIKNKQIYDLFKDYNEIVTREMSFLEDKLGYIRLGVIDHIVYPCYRKSLISEKQKGFISELERKQYIVESSGDKDYAEQKEKESFQPKK